SGSPPYAGWFRPEAPLSNLDGLSLTGLWKLQVADQANVDTGTITSWSMTVSGTTPAVCTACTPGPPGEAGPERWSSGTKTSIEWDATPGASWYTLYRGTQADFAALYSS